MPLTEEQIVLLVAGCRQLTDPTAFRPWIENWLAANNLEILARTTPHTWTQRIGNDVIVWAWHPETPDAPWQRVSIERHDPIMPIVDVPKTQTHPSDFGTDGTFIHNPPDDPLGNVSIMPAFGNH